MSIQLTTPISILGSTDANAATTTIQFDLLNNIVKVTAVYGNATSTGFVPDPNLGGVNVNFYLNNGAIFVNGTPLQAGGQQVVLSPTQITAVQTALKVIEAAIEKELVALGLFSGTVV
jgi:hypothetical protein